MKHLNSFNRFESVYLDQLGKGETIKSDVEDSTLKDIENKLKFYNQKKSTLDSIFINKNYDDSKVRSEILSKVYSNDRNIKNDLLSKYEGILWIRRNIDRVQNDIKEIPVEKSKLSKELSNLEKMILASDGDLKKDISDSILTIQSKIKSLNDKTSSNSVKIKELESKLKEEEKSFSVIQKDIVDKMKKLS